MSRFAHPGCEPMKGIDYLALSRYDRNSGKWTHAAPLLVETSFAIGNARRDPRIMAA